MIKFNSTINQTFQAKPPQDASKTTVDIKTNQNLRLSITAAHQTHTNTENSPQPSVLFVILSEHICANVIKYEACWAHLLERAEVAKHSHRYSNSCTQ